MSKFWLLVYLDFFESLRRTLFGGFLAQWETFLDRVFAFDANEAKCSLGRVTSSKFLWRP